MNIMIMITNYDITSSTSSSSINNNNIIIVMIIVLLVVTIIIITYCSLWLLENIKNNQGLSYWQLVA